MVVDAPSGFRPRRVDVLKGRKRREMKVGIAAAMRRTKVVIRRVRGFGDGRLGCGCLLVLLEN
jgi:hypothetical protein